MQVYKHVCLLYSVSQVLICWMRLLNKVMVKQMYTYRLCSWAEPSWAPCRCAQDSHRSLSVSLLVPLHFSSKKGMQRPLPSLLDPPAADPLGESPPCLELGPPLYWMEPLLPLLPDRSVFAFSFCHPWWAGARSLLQVVPVYLRRRALGFKDSNKGGVWCKSIKALTGGPGGPARPGSPLGPVEPWGLTEKHSLRHSFPPSFSLAKTEFLCQSLQLLSRIIQLSASALWPKLSPQDTTITYKQTHKIPLRGTSERLNTQVEVPKRRTLSSEDAA